jgi:predicted transcriptional regulator
MTTVKEFKEGDKVKMGAIEGTVVGVNGNMIEFQSDKTENCIWVSTNSVESV